MFAGKFYKAVDCSYGVVRAIHGLVDAIHAVNKSAQTVFAKSVDTTWRLATKQSSH
jgi:hypothetical protein